MVTTGSHALIDEIAEALAHAADAGHWLTIPFDVQDHYRRLARAAFIVLEEHLGGELLCGRGEQAIYELGQLATQLEKVAA